MNNTLSQINLTKVVEKIVSSKNVFGATLCVESGDKSISWSGAAGNMQPNDKYFIASVTKLYVSAVVLRLVEEKRLRLSDKICNYLPEELTVGLHILKGEDYSKQITIMHLISNTSGVPDYFFHKLPNGKTAASFLLEGNDEAWPLEKSIEYVKRMKPNFIPGQKGKVNYSDTNYQILGRIIEVVTGKPIGEVFKEFIFDPLGLKNTYAYCDTSDVAPTKFYYKKNELWIPKYMASVTVEGGIVSIV
jgi:CubicO group peptidase (beta-lactamase class C family)